MKGYLKKYCKQVNNNRRNFCKGHYWGFSSSNMPRSRTNRQTTYICNDLCDMQSTVGWSNSEQIFKELDRAPKCLEQTRY